MDFVDNNPAAPVLAILHPEFSASCAHMFKELPGDRRLRFPRGFLKDGTQGPAPVLKKPAADIPRQHIEIRNIRQYVDRARIFKQRRQRPGTPANRKRVRLINIPERALFRVPHHLRDAARIPRHTRKTRT
jgi:hypothetical protein